MERFGYSQATDPGGIYMMERFGYRQATDPGGIYKTKSMRSLIPQLPSTKGDGIFFFRGFQSTLFASRSTMYIVMCMLTSWCIYIYIYWSFYFNSLSTVFYTWQTHFKKGVNIIPDLLNLNLTDSSESFECLPQTCFLKPRKKSWRMSILLQYHKSIVVVFFGAYHPVMH